jgi:hypothetical protein
MQHKCNNSGSDNNMQINTSLLDTCERTQEAIDETSHLQIVTRQNILNSLRSFLNSQNQFGDLRRFNIPQVSKGAK